MNKTQPSKDYSMPMTRFAPHNRIALIGLWLAIGCFLTACESAPRVNDRDITWLELEEVMDAMQNKKDTVVVDPRSEARFLAGHIPGSIHIPLQSAQADDPRLTDAKLIIVYGTEWEDPIARAMSKKLLALKYKTVHTFRGGLKQWIVQGLEVEPPLDTN